MLNDITIDIIHDDEGIFSTPGVQEQPQAVIDHYTYRITWSAEDNEHVGLCAEFPSLSWLAPTPGEALAGVQRVVRESVADMYATGEVPPKPIAARRYSGKFMVRVPPETHRTLAMQAAEQGVSMNRLVSARLAAQIGRDGDEA